MLHQEGLDQNTIVVVVSDHGETVASWPCGHERQALRRRTACADGALGTGTAAFGKALRDLHTASGHHPHAAGDAGYTRHEGVFGAEPVQRGGAPAGLASAPSSRRIGRGSWITGWSIAGMRRAAAATCCAWTARNWWICPRHPDLQLEPAYAQRIDSFDEWVRWRHFKHSLETSAPAHAPLQTAQVHPVRASPSSISNHRVRGGSGCALVRSLATGADPPQFFRQAHRSRHISSFTKYQTWINIVFSQYTRRRAAQSPRAARDAVHRA